MNIGHKGNVCSLTEFSLTSMIRSSESTLASSIRSVARSSGSTARALGILKVEMKIER